MRDKLSKVPGQADHPGSRVLPLSFCGSQALHTGVGLGKGQML